MWVVSLRINQQWNATSYLLTREQNPSWGRVGSRSVLVPQQQKGKHHSPPVLTTDSQTDGTKWYRGDKPLDCLCGMTKIRFTDVRRPAMCGWNFSMGWVLNWIKWCKRAPGFILLLPDCRIQCNQLLPKLATMSSASWWMMVPSNCKPL